MIGLRSSGASRETRGRLESHILVIRRERHAIPVQAKLDSLVNVYFDGTIEEQVHLARRGEPIKQKSALM